MPARPWWRPCSPVPRPPQPAKHTPVAAAAHLTGCQHASAGTKPVNQVCSRRSRGHLAVGACDGRRGCRPRASSALNTAVPHGDALACETRQFPRLSVLVTSRPNLGLYWVTKILKFMSPLFLIVATQLLVCFSKVVASVRNWPHLVLKAVVGGGEIWPEGGRRLTTPPPQARRC